MNAKDILVRTRGLFAATHWQTDDYGEFNPDEQKARFCSVGGLRVVAQGIENVDTYEASWAASDGVESDEYAEALAILVCAIRGEPVPRPRISMCESDVVEWNDASDLKDVLDKFDTAIGLAEAEEAT